jgi:tetratricopeptide (TPR) repeat protein
MVGLRALDDILAGHEQGIEKPHLVELWNAQVDARNGTAHPQPAPGSTAGVPPPLIEVAGEPAAGPPVLIEAPAEFVAEAGADSEARPPPLSELSVPATGELGPAPKAEAGADTEAKPPPLPELLVPVAGEPELGTVSAADTTTPPELVADPGTDTATHRGPVAISAADTATPPERTAELPADTGKQPPLPVLARLHYQNPERLVLLLGAVVIGVLAVILLIVATHKSPDQLASRGDASRRSGNIESAIADYSEAIRIYEQRNPPAPKLADVYGSRGDLYLSRGEYGRAVGDFTAVLELEPRNARALLGRADALRAGGDRERAIADYIAAIHLDADNDLAWINRGDEWQSAGDLARALEIFRVCVAAFQGLVRAEPANVRWRRDLSLADFKVGGILYKYERFTEALDADRESLAIVRTLVGKDPNSTQLQEDMDRIIAGIGDISYHLVLRKDFARALDAAKLAISLSPKKIWLYTNQAHALMFLGRVESARSIYLQYRGQQNVSGNDAWEAVILDDFSAMRRAGLNHPLMNEIENRFGKRG